MVLSSALTGIDAKYVIVEFSVVVLNLPKIVVNSNDMVESNNNRHTNIGIE
jgi:hypothetical protein